MEGASGEEKKTDGKGNITIKPDTSLDLLDFFKDQEIVSQMLLGKKELLLMSTKAMKYGKVSLFGGGQERNFLLTNFHIYIFNKKKLKRVIRVQYLGGVTKNLAPGSKEFVIHVQNEQDYRLNCDKRLEFIDTIKLAFLSIKKNNIPIFGINKSKHLGDFVTTEKDAKKGKTRMPLQISRLYDEDVLSDEEVREAQIEMRKNGITIESPHNKITVDTNEDNLLVNIEHKQSMYKRKSTMLKAHNAPSPISKGRAETLYTRQSLPGDQDDMSQYTFEDMRLISLIGRGTFGKVYLVQNIKNKKYYAMKSIRKDYVIDNNSLESLQIEKLILLQVNHPFIISLESIFTKSARIYFVMQFVQGGEIFTHLSTQKRFNESRTKFYAAQIALALQYLHKSKIFYRDLKPENILIGLDGYIKLADFGLAKINKPQDNVLESNSFVGTPEYISPEMIDGSGHDHTLDWWALGILIYEMIVGIPPFYHRNQNQMYVLIQQAPIKWPDPQKHGISLSDEAKDIVSKLLHKDRKKRLGQKGASEILSHPFFAGLDLEKLEKKQIEPEFKPDVDETGLNNFDTGLMGTREESLIGSEVMRKINKEEDNFKDFGFGPS